MSAGAILEQLNARGIRLRRDGDSIIATPKGAVTEEVRALILAHKAELLEAVPAKGEPSEVELHLGLFACDGCRNVTIEQEHFAQNLSGRRLFFWRCKKGHKILEATYRAERILLAPSSCNDFDPVTRH